MTKEIKGFECPICGSIFKGWFSFPIGERLIFRQCQGDPRHIYFISEVGSDLKIIIEERSKRIVNYKPSHIINDDIELLLYFSMGVPINPDRVEEACKKHLDLINIIIKEEQIALSYKKVFLT